MVRCRDLFSSKKRYVSVSFVVIVVAISELNSFFLKHIFKVPTSNMINVYRLVLWTIMGAPALRQVRVASMYPMSAMFKHENICVCVYCTPTRK